MTTINYENFALRLSKLREEKDVSARDISIKLGQNPAYINNIETNKALPSLSMFSEIIKILIFILFYDTIVIIAFVFI